MTSIVRAMKDFSHPGSGHKQPVDLNRAIESTLTVSRSEWKYVADVVTDLAPDLPLVNCLAGDFNQVILNLVVNAAQAIANVVEKGAGAGGRSLFAPGRRSDWVDIRVEDTGTGIPASIRHKVFDHFFTTKEVGKGTGQGLAIAYAIVVQKHGGTIRFESEEGKGTTFIIRLPIADGTETDGANRSSNFLFNAAIAPITIDSRRRESCPMNRNVVIADAVTPRETQTKSVEPGVLLIDDDQSVLHGLARARETSPIGS